MTGGISVPEIQEPVNCQYNSKVNDMVIGDRMGLHSIGCSTTEVYTSCLDEEGAKTEVLKAARNLLMLWPGQCRLNGMNLWGYLNWKSLPGNPSTQG
eukprot:bmy_19450T0